MAETTTTTLNKHFTDTLSSGKTKHTFLAEDGGRYVTFKAQVAATAEAVIGQPVEVTYTVQQNGEYRNIYLESVKAANGSSPAEAQTGTAQAVPILSQDARQQSIQKQTSVKTSFEYAAAVGLSPSEAFGLADEILNWIEGTTEL